MNKFLLVVSSAVLLAAHAPSQTATSVYVPSNTPSAGTCNTIPFGQRSAIYQCLATQANLGNATVLNICDLAFAPCSSTTITFSTIEITIGQTKATTLSSTFSANLVTNIKKVFKATNYIWKVTGNTWNRIGLDSNYLYISTGGSLVIQVVFTGATGGTSMHRDVQPRAYALNWSGTTPPATGSAGNAALKVELVLSGSDVSTFGAGCAGSNNQTPTLSFTGNGKNGTSLSVNLSNALRNTGVLLSANVSRLEPPLDLTSLSAPGCRMYVQNLITVAGASDSSGRYSLSAKLPTNSRLCQPVYLQFFAFDRSANGLGVTSSNYGRALTGN